MVNFKSDGGVLIITWKRSKGHCGVWESSRVLDVKRGQKIYATTLLLAASVVITGNKFKKLHMLMKCLKGRVQGSAHVHLSNFFFRFISNYIG